MPNINRLQTHAAGCGTEPGRRPKAYHKNVTFILKTMATREEYEQLKAFARIDGALVGALWIVSFACFIGEFINPILGMASLVIGVSSVVFATLRLRKFRDDILDGVISFRRAFAYGCFTYFYASLLMAVAQFVYFQFMDKGFLITKYTAAMADKNLAEMMQKAYGITPDDMTLALDTLARLRPIEVALQFLTTNMILGIMISLPVAVMLRSAGKRR